jgi:phosphoglycolate phosphatase-like HAD superfamily hydrolase
VLFDIDGTLISSAGAGRRALDRAFEQLFGIRGAFASIELAGRTDLLIVRDALRAHRIVERDHDWTRFWDCYAEALAVEMRRDHPGRQVFPGVVSLLETLAARSDRGMALLTGNVRASARLKLERFDLWRYFGCGAFGDDAPDRNGLVPIALERISRHGYPRVPASRIVVIGDTPHDVACAAAAGARSLAVATGGSSVEQLHAAGADVVFETLADTRRVVAAIDTLINQPAA